MKEFLTGLHRRDCLRGYKSTIYRAGPIWQHFLNKKTSQNRFQEQPNLLLVIQSDFRISFWKSPDISKVLKDYWSALFGCMESFHCLVFIGTTHRVPNKYARTHFKEDEETFVENLYVPLKYLLWMHVDRNETRWSVILFTFVFVTFTHHHLPSFPVIPKLIVQNVISHTSLSRSTIQPRTLSHYYLLLISPSSKAPSVTSSNTSQDTSAVLLPTRSTKTRGPKRVASVASNTADLRCIFFQCPHVLRGRCRCSCWVPKKCVKTDVEK